MRLWSLSPRYLDRVGIAACWSEGLGGVRAMLGFHKMHRNHPALERFKATCKPVEALTHYLFQLYAHNINDQKANLDGAKLGALFKWPEGAKIPVTSGQIAYEQWYLWAKLRCRDERAAGRLMVPTDSLELHPLFYRVDGPVEPWEKVK